jgi:hypothetical protein
VRRFDDVDPKIIGAMRNAGLITTATVPEGPETVDLRLEGPRLKRGRNLRPVARPRPSGKTEP